MLNVSDLYWQWDSGENRNGERFRGRCVFLNKTRSTELPSSFPFCRSQWRSLRFTASFRLHQKTKKKEKKNAKIVSVVCFLCALFPFPHHLHDCQHSAWQCQLAVYRLTCRLTIACPHFLLSFSGAPRGMTLFPLLSLRILSPLQNL